MCQTQPLLVALGLLGAGAFFVLIAEMRRRESVVEGRHVWAVAFRAIQITFGLAMFVTAISAAFSGC